MCINLYPCLNKLIEKYQELFGALPPRLSCKKLVQVDLKLKLKSEGSLVRRHPHPAPPVQIVDIERHIQECMDAGLAEEYEHSDYPCDCSPCFFVAEAGSTAKRLVIDCGEVNKISKTTQGVS